MKSSEDQVDEDMETIHDNNITNTDDELILPTKGEVCLEPIDFMLPWLMDDLKMAYPKLSSEWKHTCDNCGEIFLSGETLLNHIQRMHCYANKCS